MLLNTLFKQWSYRLFAPGVMLHQTYDAFKVLLEQDGHSHDLMAGFEILYHDGKREDFAAILKQYDEFSSAVAGMINSLEQLNPTDAVTLHQYYKKFDFYIRFLLAPPEQFSIPPFVVYFDTTPEPAQTGNKAYNLAVLKNELHAPVPEGFSITTNAFFKLIDHNDFREAINNLLAAIDIEDQQSLLHGSGQLMGLIRSAEIPPDISMDIVNAYDRMERQCGGPVSCAVRSSAVSEDGVHSFAGQYHTELGVSRDTVLESYLKVVASKYTPEALFYRITVGLSDEETPIAVLVLAMVDAVASGVVYTVDPTDTEGREQIVHSIYGLGELLVSGAANADTFYVGRDDGVIRKKKKGLQKNKLVTRNDHLEEVGLVRDELDTFSISDAMARDLAEWGRKIEVHYGQPQDIEWALTDDDTLFLLQARPLQQQVESQSTLEDRAHIDAVPLFEGGKKAAGGAASGKVYLAEGRDVQGVEDGAVLVVRSTPPSLVRVLSKLAAVVADKGSTAGHFATVCREFGVPLLVNTETGTSVLSHGQEVTVDADHAVVYPGRIDLLLQGEGGGNKDDIPYFKKLRSILDFITPLKLVDPAAADFQPNSCRSMHDIIRYTHEMAVQAMFSLGDKVSGRSGNCRQLQTELPLEVYLLDVGEGICADTGAEERVGLKQICSVPFVSLWQGLSNPGVDWDAHSHFDWKSFDDIALAGGIATKDSGDFASYAIISKDYLNLNMRFGYHFTLVDALCGSDSRANYCQLRFAGGGGDYRGKTLRIEFLVAVLARLGLETNVRADLLDARVSDISSSELCHTLDMLGRLLGATKLMDMVLKDGGDVTYYVDEFFAGNYNFSG
jgi:pyruvate,water dikinase